MAARIGHPIFESIKGGGHILFSRPADPTGGFGRIAGDTFSGEIQLAEHVLCFAIAQVCQDGGCVSQRRPACGVGG